MRVSAKWAKKLEQRAKLKAETAAKVEVSAPVVEELKVEEAPILVDVPLHGLSTETYPELVSEPAKKVAKKSKKTKKKRGRIGG